MQLINLFEDNTFKLYRGDKEPYTSFTGSNMPGLLYGQQLYMTDSLVVAKEFGPYITEFHFDKAFMSKLFDVEKPMPRKMIKALAALWPNDGWGGFRLNGRDGNLQYHEWVELFKTHETRYAWTDPSIYIGGNGQYPSFDEIYHGQHAGQSMAYPLNKEITPWTILEGLGYTGITYAGGSVRTTGEGFRGGGEQPHRVVATWDFEYGNSRIARQWEQTSDI